MPVNACMHHIAARRPKPHGEARVSQAAPPPASRLASAGPPPRVKLVLLGDSVRAGDIQVHSVLPQRLPEQCWACCARLSHRTSAQLHSDLQERSKLAGALLKPTRMMCSLPFCSQGVGKSCLVLRYVRGQFDPSSKITVRPHCSQLPHATCGRTWLLLHTICVLAA